MKRLFVVYYESRKREQQIRLLLFIIRVKREVKSVHRNGCRYYERLHDETGGSKTVVLLFFIINQESES